MGEAFASDMDVCRPPVTSGAWCLGPEKDVTGGQEHVCHKPVLWHANAAGRRNFARHRDYSLACLCSQEQELRTSSRWHIPTGNIRRFVVRTRVCIPLVAKKTSNAERSRPPCCTLLACQRKFRRTSSVIRCLRPNSSDWHIPGGVPKPFYQE